MKILEINREANIKQEHRNELNQLPLNLRHIRRDFRHLSRAGLTLNFYIVREMQHFDCKLIYKNNRRM